MGEYWGDIFRQLGIADKAKQFWAAANSGNYGRARQLFAEMEQVVQRTGNMSRVAGTFGRMRATMQGAAAAAEMAPAAAGELSTLGAEAATAGAEDVALAGATGAETTSAGAGVLALFIEGGALTPLGWAVVAGVVFVALSWAAFGEEAPPPRNRNPFRKLPNDPGLNPVAKINQQAGAQFRKHQQWRQQHCKCNGRRSLPNPGPGLHGRGPSAMLAAATMPPAALCSWPNCPKGRAVA